MKTFIVLFGLSLVCFIKGDDICGPGGQYDLCASPCHPVPSCAYPNPKPPPPDRVCAAVCLTRCSCSQGYVVHNKKCIKLEDCPK